MWVYLGILQVKRKAKIKISGGPNVPFYTKERKTENLRQAFAVLTAYFRLAPAPKELWKCELWKP